MLSVGIHIGVRIPGGYMMDPYTPNDTLLHHVTDTQDHADTTMTSYLHQEGTNSALSASKVDPSYKSKRYRDKLRTEVKALENLLPVDRSSLHRKLDSQTVFRLVIAYFRTKMFLEAAASKNQFMTDEKRQIQPTASLKRNISHLLTSNQLLQALEGFLLVVTADGTILYVSRNIVHSLGFNQVDLMHRCVYGIVHPDDHHELKMVLETSLLDTSPSMSNQRSCCAQESPEGATCKSVSFLVRIKCFNGTTTGYLKMQCSGHMRSFPTVVPSSRTSNQVIFAFCRPFTSATTDTNSGNKTSGFWSKHGLDLRFRHLDTKTCEVIGYDIDDLEGESFYTLVHPEDLGVFSTCHKALIHTEDIQTMYFRLQTKDGQWIWLHTRGKVVFKNSKKYSIVFTHCPVREEDSTYIQQEAVVRRRYIIHDVISRQNQSYYPLQTCPHVPPGSHCHYPGCTNPAQYSSQHNLSVSSHSVGTSCPSTWHSKSECHSPVFPTTSLPHRYNIKEEPAAEVHGNAAKRPRLCDTDNSKMSPDPQHIYNGSTQPLSDLLVFHKDHGGSTEPTVRGQHLDSSGSYQKDHQRVPPPQLHRRYLMQVNGIGVSGEHADAPTTLFFQGQFTAYTEPPVHEQGHVPPGWASGSHTWGHQGMSGFSSQSHGANRSLGIAQRGLSLPLQDVCPVSWPNRTPTTLSGVVTDITDNLALGSQGSCQQQPQKQQKDSSVTRLDLTKYLSSNPQLNVQSCGNALNPGQTETDSKITSPCVSYPASALSGPLSHPKPDQLEHHDTSGCLGSTSDPKAAFSKANPGQEMTSETKDEAGIWRAPCLYQSCSAQAWTSAGASCFRPPSPPQVVCVQGVKKEAEDDKQRPAGESELPTIGSFLEYLKDISG